jgi:PIN domain nuclease of toxin-antitoxin system
MIAGVADTHAALWYLFGDPRLSAPAKPAFDAAASFPRRIVLSVISLAEVVYLVAKNRLPTSAYADLKTALHDPDHVLQEAPVTAEIIDTGGHPCYAGPHCRGDYASGKRKSFGRSAPSRTQV